MLEKIFLVTKKYPRVGMALKGEGEEVLLIERHPFLEYLLAWLKRYGLTDIIICSGYLSSLIEEYFGSGKVSLVDILN